MKKLLFVITMLFASTAFAAEKKEVCVDQKQKDGTSKQVCKQIKVHKKLEVADAKKDDKKAEAKKDDVKKDDKKAEAKK